MFFSDMRIAATGSIGLWRPSGTKEQSNAHYGPNRPATGNPAVLGKPFRPVALRIRLSANLPFSVDRDSAD
jgi:hypothetical protein